MHPLQQTGLFMLDMDGTFYLGNTLLPGAKKLLEVFETLGIEYVFVTNNSSRNKQNYLDKLAALGVDIPAKRMFTSGDATLEYLAAEHYPKEILLVGTPALEEQFAGAGFIPDAPEPKAAVLGFDTTLTYEKLTKLCNAVRKGLPYIATHPDFNCPVPGGYIPDIGAVIAFVHAATGRHPDVVIGKPNPGMAKAAAHKFNLPLNKLCMVGDRLYTDIALGKAGIGTVLVLSGETTLQDLEGSDIRPDYVFDNLAGLADALEVEKPF